MNRAKKLMNEDSKAANKLIIDIVTVYYQSDLKAEEMLGQLRQTEIDPSILRKIGEAMTNIENEIDKLQDIS